MLVFSGFVKGNFVGKSYEILPNYSVVPWSFGTKNWRLVPSGVIEVVQHLRDLQVAADTPCVLFGVAADGRILLDVHRECGDLFLTPETNIQKTQKLDTLLAVL